MATYNDNKLFVRTGFTVENEVAGIDKIAAQLKKINTESQKLGESVKSIEQAFAKLGIAYEESTGKIISSSQKTKTQLNEDAKRQTINEKAEAAIRVKQAEAEVAAKKEAAKQATIIAREQQKRITEEQKTAEIARRKEIQQTVAVQQQAYKQMVSDYRSAANQMKQIGREIQQIAKLNTTFNVVGRGGTLGSSLTNTFLQVTGVRTLLMQFAQVSRDVVEVEKNAINIQRIMKDTTDSLKTSLADSAMEIAKNTATLVTDVQDIESAWVRVNEQYQTNLDLLNKITEATAKFVNVGEIEDAGEAVTLLNSAILQFNMFTEDGNVNLEQALSTLDKWAYMADATALGTADEFGDSISRFGGMLQALGGNMDDAIVLTAILGDRLAKTGDEAGNALKTIMSYLNRDKTINLFNKLSLDADGLTDSLMKTETEFEEFQVIMDTVSKAYNTAMANGDEVTARAIQQAIGATRQGDAAIALLKNWTSDYAKYTEMLNSESVDGYLDKQNEALLESFSAQWTSLKNSMVDAGYAIAESGLFDDLSSLMEGLGNLLDGISDADPIVLGFASTLTEVAVALMLAQKLAKATGVWEVFATGMKYGATSAREAAAAIAAETLAIENEAVKWAKSAEAKLLYMNLPGFEEATLNVLAGIEATNAELNKQTALYQEGKISVETYTAALNKANLEMQEHLATLNAMQKEGAETIAVQNGETQADIEGAIANEANADSELKDAEANDINTGSTARVTGAQIKETVADSAGALANLKNGFSNLFSSVRGGLSSVGTAIKTMFTSPMAKVTLVIMGAVAAFKGIKMAVDHFWPSLETLKERLDETNSELNSLESELNTNQERLRELYDLAASGMITITEQQELNRLQLQNELLDDQIELLKERQELQQKDVSDKAYSDILGLDNFVLEDDGSTSAYNDVEYFEYLLEQRENLVKLQSSVEAGGEAWNSYKRQISDLDTQLSTFSLSLLDQSQYLTNTDENTLALLASINELSNAYQAALQGISPEQFAFNEYFNSEGFADAKQKLVELVRAGKFSEDTLNQYPELVAHMDAAGISAEQLVLHLNSIAYSAGALSEENGISNLSDTLSDTLDSIDDISDAISKIGSGKIDNQGIIDLINTYEGFAAVANKSEAEQIAWLRQHQQELVKAYDADVLDAYNTLLKQQSAIEEQIVKQKARLAFIGKGSDLYADEYAALLALEDALADVEKQLGQVSALGDIDIKIDFKTDFVGEIDNVLSGIKALTDAQYQLAQGTRLSTAELWELCNTYPELLTQADLFNATTVEGQQAAINAVLGMKEQEFDATIDQKIALLKAEEENVVAQIDIENQKLAVLDQLHLMELQGKNAQDVEYQKALAQLQELEATNYFNMEQAILTTQDNALVQREENEESANQSTANQAWDTANEIAGSTADAAKTGASNLGVLGNSARSKFITLGGVTRSFARAVAAAFGGVEKNVSGSTVGTGLNGDVSYTAGVVGTIEGIYSGDTSSDQGSFTVQKAEFIESLKSQYKEYLGDIRSAIGNLEAFKGLDLGNVTGSYGSSSGSGGSGGSGSSSNTDDTQSIIDGFFDDFVSNIESLQDRIVKALKEKYQELYDERVKFLEKERDAQITAHEERIEQLQAEIDKLNGDTTEDKYKQRDSLQEQLNAWMVDNSSLGKGKQKELIDQIAEIDKEIKIDELEAEIDKEEESINLIEQKYNDLLDEESENYDSVLKELSKKMTDEQLYAQANDLIRNNKIQDIVDLLTEYDPDYSGMAQLMGKTAGEIIAEEVGLAMANWLDIISGTIDKNGGAYTNAVINTDYVKGLYKTLLGREADEAGLSGWVAAMQSGMTQEEVRNAFLDSSEYKEKYIKDLYKTLLGRKPDDAGFAHWIDMINAGMSLADVRDAFLNSEEYKKKQTYKEELKSSSDTQTSTSMLSLATSEYGSNPLVSAVSKVIKNKLIKYDTGGANGDYEGAIYIHKKERVLTESQNAAWERLVYDFMPQIATNLTRPARLDEKNIDNSITFNKEVMSINIDKVVNNTEFDVKNTQDNIERMLKKSLIKSGMNIKR